MKKHYNAKLSFGAASLCGMKVVPFRGNLSPAALNTLNDNSSKGGNKMRRKNVLAVIALVAVFVLALTACGSKKAEETTVATTTEAAPQELGLSTYDMTATTWSSPNGATINLTAVPTIHEDGQTAAFIVRLEGEDVANIPCEWNGTSYTASAELNAEDGYCYYVILTAADGAATEVAVNTPTAPVYASFINMASSLNSYCNLMIEESSFDGSKLTISGGSVQVQAPKITNNGEEITCAEVKLVLSYNGEDVANKALTLEESESVGGYEAALSGISFDVPANMEDDQQLNLRVDVTLSNGQSLTAPGGTWYYNDSSLLVAVG